MNNEQWGQKLRAAYGTAIRALDRDDSGNRLPAPNQILFDGEKERVTVSMNQEAVVANMQTNAAAFEAWSLALKVWCDVDTVELKWERPFDSVSPEWYHYQRFLFRVERFCRLCSDWFHLTDRALLSDAEALGPGPFFLNVPGDRTPFEEPLDGDRTDGDEQSSTEDESSTEKALVRSDSFRRHFRLARKR